MDEPSALVNFLVGDAVEEAATKTMMRALECRRRDGRGGARC